MSFMARMYNMWKGFLSLFATNIEEKHPEIAYENAINSMSEKYMALKSAVSRIIARREQLSTRIKKHENELADIRAQVQVAVEQNEDEAAMVLLERQTELEKALAEDSRELDETAKEAEVAKDSLRSVQAEIEKLKRERDRVVATIKDSEARKQIDDQLQGISVDAEVKALQSVRDYADRVKGEVKLNSELRESSLEGKLAKIKQQTGSLEAKQKLAALKAARGATATQGTGEPEGGKTL
jgi:phage shock protein A